MFIGERLRSLRESRGLSQGDIEKRTGLIRCYISRVENGYTVPPLGTLEKFARAMEVSLYRVFYEGENPPRVSEIIRQSTPHEAPIEGNSRDALYLRKLRKCLAKLTDADKNLLLGVASRMANR